MTEPGVIFYKSKSDKKEIEINIGSTITNTDLYATTPITCAVEYEGHQLTFSMAKNEISLIGQNNVLNYRPIKLIFNFVTYLISICVSDNILFDKVGSTRAVVTKNIDVVFRNYQDYKIYSYLLTFTIKDWNHKCFNYRMNAEKHIQNMLDMITGWNCPIFKLKDNESQLALERKEDGHIYDKAFAISFGSFKPIDVEITKEGIESCSFLEFLSLGITGLADNYDQAEINQVMLYEDPYKNMPMTIIHNDLEGLYEHYMYLKPNGIKRFEIFIDLIKNNLFIPKEIMICETTDENIRYFYPNAHKYNYGYHWYNYLKQNKMVLIRYLSNLDMQAIGVIKSKFRTLSGFNWTLNVVHIPIDNEEHLHFKNFFDCKKNNTIPNWLHAPSASTLSKLLNGPLIKTTD